MTKKLFIKLSMLLFVLSMSTNVAWGINLSGMTDEQAETNGFWARLTATHATTTNGSGKVFVIDEDHYESDPGASDYAETHYADGWSDVFVQTSLIDGDVHFRTYSKADAGSYFIGWSFTDGNTDLGTDANITPEVTPSSKSGHANIREYTIYAAFEKVKLTSYEFVSGSNTTTKVGDDWTCTQTIKFRAETPGANKLSNTGDYFHFKRPVVTKKDGTNGTWSIGDAAWIGMGAGQNFYPTSEGYAELIVPVVFTAPDGNPGEYAAELVLETYAGVKMKVYLYARTTGETGEATRYNSAKVQYDGEDGSGTLSSLLGKAVAGDIIKLNGNYENAVNLNKDITFDLNGFTLNNTLTVSGGNVTIAYSPYGGSANALSVSGGKAILNGGTFGSLTIGESGTVEQNGATITGAATNNGSLTTTDGTFQGGLESNKTLVVNGGTFTGATAIDIKAGSADIKKGTITGTTYGIQSKGTTTIGKLAVISGGTIALNRISGTLTVNGGRFKDPNNMATGEIVFNAAYFQTNSTESATVRGKQVWRNTAGTEARAGYAFFAGDQATAQAYNVSVCRIGQAAYSSLEEALAYANNNPSQGVIIIMENDYVLPAGYYTLPANATLIVPMSNDQQSANLIVPRETSGTPMPVPFRKLTFANGVNMTVAGTIELTCTQYGSGEQMGLPGGNYGHLILKPGSHITINNGGELRAWGFVSGDGSKDAEGNYLSGEIDARRGSIVREMFQMGDWKGGDISFTIAMELPDPEMPNYRDMAHLFPVYTYFIQNVESPVKYHPGSSLICATSVNVSGNINAFANEIKVVGKNGEAAMFLMDEMADAENTWVRKFYDAKNDKQVYEVNSGAQLGSLVIELGEVPAALFGGGAGKLKLELDSRKFVLPLTNNFKIHLLTGNMQFTQSTSCLPGMEVEIDKESEIAIINQGTEGVVEGALYLYDADQWSFQNAQQKGYVGNSGKFGAIVRYSPTWDLGTNGVTKQPNARSVDSPAAIGDAILNVHGTFRMGENCAVYTTWSKDMNTYGLDNSESASGGASIISSNEDAGTFIFEADAPNAFQGLIWDFSDPENPQIVGFNPDVLVNYDHNNYGLGTQYPIQIQTVLNSTERVFGVEFCTSAKLTNGDGTLAETQGMLAGTSYCYMNGRWTSMEVASENDCFMKDNYGTFYAKPSEYIAVVATVDGSGNVVGNDDHTYSDAAGAGRLFILMQDECQWWEVEKKYNFYHCIHPNNDTYYYWDGTEGKWMEQRFTITWKNYDGTELKSYTYDAVTGEPEEVDYSVTYGTQAEYLGEVPTRPADIDYTYSFTGWSPALGKVTSDVTYTATYEAQPRKYTIIFENEGGDEIERQFLTHNEVPVCENVPTRTGFTLEWEPAIAAVVGDATYRATWLEVPPTEYAITFYDYDGTTKLKPTGETPYMVAVGAMPTPPAQVNGKEPTMEYTYVFDHWSPAIEKVSATSVKSYTAVYREEAISYTVIFQDEDGSEIERHEYAWGETPVCSATPSKANTPQYTYSLAWDPQIQTVQGVATYRATFPATENQYALTLKCTPSGAAIITGARADYTYGATPTITVTPNSGYNFLGWSDSEPIGNKIDETYYSRTVEINGNIELTAIFECPDCEKSTIVWKNENGEGDPIATASIPVGSATVFFGETPTKSAEPQYTYTFYGWTTEPDGAGTKYKNGLTPVVAEAQQTYTYYACFTPAVRQYNVALTSNIANVCTLVGAGSYDYSSEWANATVIVSGYDATNYTFDGWYNTADDQVSGDESYSFAVHSDVSLVAKFSPVTYTVTWMSENGLSVLETDEEQAYGAATAFNGSEPTKEDHTFIGWTTAANGGGSFYTKGATPVVSGNATYYAYYAENAKSLVIDINSSETLESPTDYASFVLTSDGEHSGQLINANNLSVLGEVIFRMEKTFNAGEWYAVAVPWTVSPSTGIYAGSIPLSLGSQIYVIEFDANAYAGGSTNTYDYWHFLHQTGADMVPGKLYMIYLTSAQSALDFHKKVGAAILTTQTSVAVTGGSGERDNWNAIANPALYHANLSTGATLVQKYNGNDSYIVGSTSAMIVGEPMFVQVTSASIVDATPIGGASSAPYRRTSLSEDNAKFVVEIAQNNKITDRLIVETTDEKENKYVIGQDLAKFGVSSKVAQMWINRYDAKLCVNTVVPFNGVAEYPLSIFAPASGEYQISNVKSQISNDVEYELYLTLNGQAIWNLSDGAYVLNLNKGTVSNYGLRVSASAPQNPTGVDEAIVDAQGDTRKVLIGNQVFIIRGDKVYSVDGRLVK